MEITYCPWEPATYFFISSNVPLLIHYSHFIAIFAALAISLLVFFNNPKSPISRLFVIFSGLFSVWALLDVGLWATNDPGIVMFSWSMQVLLEPLTFAVAFYLFYIFIHSKIPSFKLNLFIAAILLPLIVLLPTTLNLEALLLSACESVEGPLAKYYTYFLNLVLISLIIYTGIKQIPKLDKTRQKSSVYFIIGLVTFLLSFTSGNVISSFTDDWTISQYGLFGMPVFAFLMAYSIVQFRTFKVEIAGAQILVVILWALVGSLLFVESELLKIIVFITLIFTTVAGHLLVRSVKQEFAQKLELEKLTKQLETANKRLKVLDQMKSEFVSIASHQLRSPLTSIRGYASMLLEGSYGKLPQKAVAGIERIAESSRLMAGSIEDYLNVSRIQAGNMKYEFSDFNLKEMVEGITDDMRQIAVKKGLVLLFKSSALNGKGMVHADVGKVNQIVRNLIDNSIKYTPEGKITVTMRDDKKQKKIFVEVSDTGVGMDAKALEEIFDKFVRAKNANSVNVTGTGLGLFVARQMAEAMSGKITPASEGENKGSTFVLELPLKA